MLALLAIVFTLEGRIEPPARAAVTLQGAVTPFNAIVITNPDGKFTFKRIEKGVYTLDAFVPGVGSVRRTLDIGPSTANEKRVVRFILPMEDATARPDRSGTITMSQLAVPDKAKARYGSALRKLSKRDVPGAVADLEYAIALAPNYAEAWNYLGTIRYQTANFSEAEKCFRKSLEADLDYYAPLVNLGGVLLNLNRPQEALRYNQYAALREPKDALAHSQLGMTYFMLGYNLLAERSLKEAIRLDAGHFSHPQMVLAELYILERRWDDAEVQLEEFLKLHPDDAKAKQVRESLKLLRQRI